MNEERMKNLVQRLTADDVPPSQEERSRITVSAFVAEKDGTTALCSTVNAVLLGEDGVRFIWADEDGNRKLPRLTTDMPYLQRSDYFVQISNGMYHLDHFVLYRPTVRVTEDVKVAPSAEGERK